MSGAGQRPDADFNPRIPYGMRLGQRRRKSRYAGISIHASRMGCDLQAVGDSPVDFISIHASRMGCDHHVGGTTRIRAYFNPRIPYGMRPLPDVDYGNAAIFQSTHPVWDATTPPVAKQPKR